MIDKSPINPLDKPFSLAFAVHAALADISKLPARKWVRPKRHNYSIVDDSGKTHKLPIPTTAKAPEEFKIRCPEIDEVQRDGALYMVDELFKCVVESSNQIPDLERMMKRKGLPGWTIRCNAALGMVWAPFRGIANRKNKEVSAHLLYGIARTPDRLARLIDDIRRLELFWMELAIARSTPGTTPNIFLNPEDIEPIMLTLKRLGAVDRGTRQPSETVVRETHGQYADYNNYKTVIAEAVRQKRIGSKEGRGGGIWLLENAKR